MAYTHKSSIISKTNNPKSSGYDIWNSLNRTVYTTSTRLWRKLGLAILVLSTGALRNSPISKLPSKLLRNSNCLRTKRKLSSSRRIFCSFAITPTLSGFMGILIPNRGYTLLRSCWPRGIYSSIPRNPPFWRSIKLPSFSSSWSKPFII